MSSPQFIKPTGDSRSSVFQGDPEWFAVHVRSNHEGAASVHLRARGYQEYSPCSTVQRQWSDRKKAVVRYLFPGYVFCQNPSRVWTPILTIPGVCRIVGIGNMPVPIPEIEIERIRKMVASGVAVIPCPFLNVGESVLIEQGPLAGVEGIIEEAKGKFRLVVSIHLLQRSISAEIDREWVRPLRNRSIRPAAVRLDDERFARIS